MFMKKSLLLIVCYLSACSDTGEGKQTPELAYQNCKQAVLASLKAPSTAKFEDYHTGLVSVKKQIKNKMGEKTIYYKVYGEVDSQNSYGAMIRSTFSCEFTSYANGSWYLDEIGIF
jgi:hypothetical protein